MPGRRKSITLTDAICAASYRDKLPSPVSFDLPDQYSICDAQDELFKSGAIGIAFPTRYGRPLLHAGASLFGERNS